MSDERHHDEHFDTAQEPLTRRQRREAGGAAKRKRLGGGLEFLITVAIAFVLVFGFVRPFVAEAFWIPSGSMVPTLQEGDEVLVNKFIYGFTDPDRGDVVVFESVEGGEEVLIKRVVGLPGDTVAVREGTLYVNGELQQEPYIADGPCTPSQPRTCSFGPIEIPKDHYFMMGDNRSNSTDSRYFGPVPEENLVGEAFLRFWPPGHIGLL